MSNGHFFGLVIRNGLSLHRLPVFFQETLLDIENFRDLLRIELHGGPPVFDS